MSGMLIDVAKHLSNLKYSIWENTNDHLQYSESLLIYILTSYFCPMY